MLPGGGQLLTGSAGALLCLHNAHGCIHLQEWHQGDDNKMMFQGRRKKKY